MARPSPTPTPQTDDPRPALLRRCQGVCWPTRGQQLLLKTLFLPDEQARLAFRQWMSTVDLATVDAGSLSMMPLLHRRLSQLNPRHPLAPRLQGAYRYHWCRNRVRFRESLAGIDRVLQVTPRVLALKGMALLDVYGDVGLRPLSDLDVLVPPDAALSTLRALLADGWRLREGLHPADLPHVISTAHGHGLWKGRAELDVHWAALAEDTSPGADLGLWERAESFDFQGRKLLRPSATDLLFHVCVHGARYSRAMSICWVPDAMLLMERAISWSALVSITRERRMQVPVGEALRFSSEHLGAQVPQDVFEQLSAPHPAWLFWLEHEAWSAPPRTTSSLHRAVLRVTARLRRGQPLPEDIDAMTSRA